MDTIFTFQNKIINKNSSFSKLFFAFNKFADKKSTTKEGTGELLSHFVEKNTLQALSLRGENKNTDFFFKIKFLNLQGEF